MDKLIETQEIKLADEDVADIYGHFGIKITAQPKPHSESKRKERYVRTIPLPWVIRACALKGKALHVGIVLWYFCGLAKSNTVKLTPSRLTQFGINRETGRRALRTLEEFGLVSVERKGHKSPVVTLL